MADFWNFHDTLYVAAHNWFWLLVAFGIGIVIGWMTCTQDQR